MSLKEGAGANQTSRGGLRNAGAFLLGKLLISTTRLLKYGGTTLPGRAALTISPELIPFLARRLESGTVAVTGTNGKTTTATLLASIFEENGRQYIHNRAGANLSWGLATALIEGSSWRSGGAREIAVLEIDEGAFPSMAEMLQPRCAVVTNIFRDQLDRFGGVEQVGGKIEKGIQAAHPGATICLNADDPLVAAMESGGRDILYFGFDLPAGRNKEKRPQSEILCPRCRRELIYSEIYYAHLGRYRCPSCGFHRPEPEIKLRHFETAGDNGKTLLTLSLRGRPLRAALPLPGIYNLYNALAAAAAAAACALPESAIEKAFAKASPPAGRMERRLLGSKHLLLALIKNPAGANEIFRTLLEEKGHQRFHLLIAINDRVADGGDISWLQETDFERLAGLPSPIGGMVFSGTRAGKAKERTLEAGLDPAEMHLLPPLPEGLQKALALTAAGEELIIIANYTAMAQLRRLLAGR